MVRSTAVWAVIVKPAIEFDVLPDYVVVQRTIAFHSAEHLAIPILVLAPLLLLPPVGVAQKTQTMSPKSRALLESVSNQRDLVPMRTGAVFALAAGPLTAYPSHPEHAIELRLVPHPQHPERSLFLRANSYRP